MVTYSALLEVKKTVKGVEETVVKEAFSQSTLGKVTDELIRRILVWEKTLPRDDFNKIAEEYSVTYTHPQWVDDFDENENTCVFEGLYTVNSRRGVDMIIEDIIHGDLVEMFNRAVRGYAPVDSFPHTVMELDHIPRLVEDVGTLLLSGATLDIIHEEMLLFKEAKTKEPLSSHHEVTAQIFSQNIFDHTVVSLVEKSQLSEAQQLLLMLMTKKKNPFWKNRYSYQDKLAKLTVSPRVLHALTSEIIWETGAVFLQSVLKNPVVTFSILQQLMWTVEDRKLYDKYFYHPAFDDAMMMRYLNAKHFGIERRNLAYRYHQKKHPELNNVPFEWFEATH